jgi:hypothetical protein
MWVVENTDRGGGKRLRNRNPLSGLLLAVDRDSVPITGGEEVKHFAWFRMAPSFGFGVDQIPVDRDIEDSFGACDEREGIHDVLISREDVVRCAHGAVQIVSGNAVRDLDLKHEAKVAACHPLLRHIIDRARSLGIAPVLWWWNGTFSSVRARHTRQRVGIDV